MESVLNQRENNFDFIRLFLANLVIFSHSFPLGAGTEANEPLAQFTHRQVTVGAVAVNLFFVISGFLVTASFERSPSFRNYLKKRVRRIYPGFITVMLISALVIVPVISAQILGQSVSAKVANFAWCTLRLVEFHYVNAFPNNPAPGWINAAAWSIPYEFRCYLAVALLGVTGLLRKRNFILGLFGVSIAVSVLFSVFAWHPGSKTLGNTLGYPAFWARLMPLYLAGVVFYIYRSHFRLRISWAAASVIILVAASYVRWGWSAAFPLAGTYLAFFFAYHPAIQFHNTARYGDFSYGTYLYAYPTMQLIMRWVGHPVSPIKLFLLASPLTFLLAVASWHGVEKWFLKSTRTAQPVPTLSHQ